MSDREWVLQITHSLREYGFESEDELDRKLAIEAADIIESLQRERDNPQPMTTSEPTAIELDCFCEKQPIKVANSSEPTTGEIVRALKAQAKMELGGQAATIHLTTIQNAIDRLESQEQTIADLRETLRITCENWSESSNEKNVQIAALTARAEQAENKLRELKGCL